MVLYAETFIQLADRRNVWCKKDRSKNRSLWHAGLQRDYSRRAVSDANKKRTVRQIRVDPTERSALDAEFCFESCEQFWMTDSVKCGRDVAEPE